VARWRAQGIGGPWRWAAELGAEDGRGTGGGRQEEEKRREEEIREEKEKEKKTYKYIPLVGSLSHFFQNESIPFIVNHNRK